MRKRICELLTLSPRPLKAKEIARVLSSDSSTPLSKREVNPILYELEKCGILLRSENRWSICSRAIRREGTSNQFIPTVDPEEEKRIRDQARELGPRPISAPIGHWIFRLGREPATGREVWRIECALCGFQTGCRVQSHQQVYPLTGKLRDRRRKHDKTVHPHHAKDQIRAESLLLGKKAQPRLLRNNGE